MATATLHEKPDVSAGKAGSKTSQADKPATPADQSAKPKLADRERYILTQLVQARKACTGLVKAIRAGEKVEVNVIRAASEICSAYSQSLLSE